MRGGHVNKTIDMMVTPRVVAEVRKHFNCEKLEGAELEDQGGEGTALTHWEKRILEVGMNWFGIFTMTINSKKLKKKHQVYTVDWLSSMYCH